MSLSDYDSAWDVVKNPKSSTTSSGRSASPSTGNADKVIPQIKIETVDALSSSDEMCPIGQDQDAGSVDGSNSERCATPDTSVGDGTSDNEVAASSNDQTVDDDEDETQTIPRIMDVTEMSTRTGQSVITRSRRFRKPKTKKTKFQEYAGVHRRILNEMGINIATTLEIKSPFLRKALKELLKDQQRINLDADPITISKPYEPLFYQRKAIREYRDAQTDDQARIEMDMLVEFMDLNLDDIQREYDQNVAHGRITTDMAWTLFPPGEVVVFGADSPMPIQCLVVKDCRRQPRQIPQLQLKCNLFEFNGRKFGKSFRNVGVILPQQSGPYPITDLPMYPLRFHPNPDQLRQTLIERGRKYVDVVKRAHMNYKYITHSVVSRHELTVFAVESCGRSILLMMKSSKYTYVFDVYEICMHTNVHQVKGRVMIDYNEYVRQSPPAAARLEGELGVNVEETDDKDACWCGNPNCAYVTSSKSSTDTKGAKVGGDDGKPDEHKHELSEDEVLLCPGRVKGFALTDKCWAEFRIDKLTHIEWNKDAYNRLEMEEDPKHVIKALVESHRKHSDVKSADFDDIIAGKGLGLVFLLQGPPGLGKTLTAESVAEQAKKPLYAVTSGELGTTVNDMETALAKAFRIAKEWNAILLLDEADVFLSKRTVDNLEKNAFVSVFLRLMEYYQGILFLTTNRVDDFDPAFLSRIHLIIDYKKLTPERRGKIWQNLSSNLEKDESLDVAGLNELGRMYDINGREIKNLLRTAWSLAKEEQRKLTMKDIQTVATIRQETVVKIER